MSANPLTNSENPNRVVLTQEAWDRMGDIEYWASEWQIASASGETAWEFFRFFSPMGDFDNVKDAQEAQPRGPAVGHDPEGADRS